MVNMDGFEGMDEDDSFDGDDGDFINFDIACPTPPTHQHSSQFEEPSEHLYATLEEVDLDHFEAFYEEPPIDANGSGIKGGIDS